MLSRFIGENRVYKLILFLYFALASGLTFSKIVLSMATILLVLIVFLDFNTKQYKNAIKGNRIIQLLLVFLLFHLLTYFWSENTSYFLKDLNSKLPFYVIPIIFILKPIQEKNQIYLILFAFLLGLTTISLFNFISYYGWRKTEFDDIRSLSYFASHIRFGLMVVFGIVLSLFWLKTKSLKFKLIPILLLFWFLVYTYFSEVLSSYLALFGMILMTLIYYVFKNKHKVKILSLLVIFIFISLISTFYLYKNIESNYKLPDEKSLLKQTIEGNEYEHYLQHKFFINGNHVYSYICGAELYRDWPNYSTIKLNDTLTDGTELYYILIQYMTSKGLKKDAAGLKQLNTKDIKNIEAGRVRYNDKNEGFITRLNTIYEEFNDDNPNGKTIKQRFEYLKAGKQIFYSSPIFGIGSGDIQDGFERYYVKSNSKLNPENRLRTHNQIFTYFITFGILGGSIFISALFFSFQLFFKTNNLLAFLFMTIITISFLSEDTLETQIGATFFALFFGLFISSTKSFKNEN